MEGGHHFHRERKKALRFVVEQHKPVADFALCAREMRTKPLGVLAFRAMNLRIRRDGAPSCSEQIPCSSN